MKMKELLALGRQEGIKVTLRCSKATYDIIQGKVARPITEPSIWDAVELFLDESIPFGLIQPDSKRNGTCSDQNKALSTQPQTNGLPRRKCAKSSATTEGPRSRRS